VSGLAQWGEPLIPSWNIVIAGWFPFWILHVGVLEENCGNTLKIFARCSTLGMSKEILKGFPLMSTDVRERLKTD